ncbi:60S ribosomal protein L9 [Lactuca sativa]|uniref:Uncharacterized protein n=1 Tax=Lactuca sativa TaxID=4236 RepID=A0A9R1UGN5_LACSA|nr:60S ribosomal protein L9 [Lactuca sativa]KAJ0186747.1 hypothetical protein LSAT_V11C900471500 [Lactuca sativa]
MIHQVNLSYSSHSCAAYNLSSALRLLHFVTAIVRRASSQVRKVDMLDGVTVVRYKKVKDELILDGNDNELKCVMKKKDIQKFLVMKNKDIQKFLDGNYVSNKGKIEFCDN